CDRRLRRAEHRHDPRHGTALLRHRQGPDHPRNHAGHAGGPRCGPALPGRLIPKKQTSKQRSAPMSWFDETIMARKGVARGKAGETYSITEESQGKYHYVYGAFVDPVLKVDPGSIVSAETHDAFE